MSDNGFGSDRRAIMVGVDGSPASLAALRWALRRAADEHATVTAIEVAQQPVPAPATYVGPAHYSVVPPNSVSRLRDSVVCARDSGPDVPTVDEVRVTGVPGVELARAAEDALMLVLGRTPHGRLAEFVLGSVARECLRYARCPVVLVAADEAT